MVVFSAPFGPATARSRGLDVANWLSWRKVSSPHRAPNPPVWAWTTVSLQVISSRSSMVIASLSLIVLRCSDLDASKRFYESLGLLMTPVQHQTGPLHWSCRLGHTVVELCPAGDEVPQAIRLGFYVRDVQTAVDVAFANGGRLLHSFDAARTVVLDPDGNKIEFTPPLSERPRCDECGSPFFAGSSPMVALCPECAHWLYGYANCEHQISDGACHRCGWDGAVSAYVESRKRRAP